MQLLEIDDYLHDAPLSFYSKLSKKELLEEYEARQASNEPA